MKSENALVIGSGNTHKAAELGEILRGLPWTIVTLNSFPHVAGPSETGDTFEANALIKALHYRASCKLPCISDDSGLEVDALGGAPGVYSARFAGPAASSHADNNAKLLEALQDKRDSEWAARFVCCAAFANLDGSVYIVRGTVDGKIVPESRGTNGFGYDPIFVPGGSSITFAEMSPAQKHAVSHRGRAFHKLREYLERLRCVS